MFKNARLALAGAVFTAFALPALAQDAPTAQTVIARVGDAEITLGHAIAMRSQLPPQFAQVPDATLLPAIVQQLIEQEVLAQSRTGQLSAAERLMLDNETRSFLANSALLNGLQDAVTDETVDAAYQAFATQFAEGEPATEYHAAHILVRDEETLAQVEAALAEGRDFADVAREFSLDGSAQNGGDLGWFAAGVMIPDFQAAVEALEPGQVSDPVQTRFGWHVIRLIETRDAEVPPLEAVRDDLVGQIQRDATQALIARLGEGVATEDLSEGLDPALLSDTSLLDE